MAALIFPPLETLEDYAGDFRSWFEAVYDLFVDDFVRSKPSFKGTRVNTKAYPLTEGKNRTFFHITHEGADEQARLPDTRRMERIRYPGFFIRNSPHSELLIWENERGTERRILIFHEAEGYLVVLSKRADYVLLWTAYLVEQPHRKRKLIQEYEAYQNAEAAQGY